MITPDKTNNQQPLDLLALLQTNSSGSTGQNSLLAGVRDGNRAAQPAEQAFGSVLQNLGSGSSRSGEQDRRASADRARDRDRVSTNQRDRNNAGSIAESSSNNSSKRDDDSTIIGRDVARSSVGSSDDSSNRSTKTSPTANPSSQGQGGQSDAGSASKSGNVPAAEGTGADATEASAKKELENGATPGNVEEHPAAKLRKGVGVTPGNKKTAGSKAAKGQDKAEATAKGSSETAAKVDVADGPTAETSAAAGEETTKSDAAKTEEQAVGASGLPGAAAIAVVVTTLPTASSDAPVSKEAAEKGAIPQGDGLPAKGSGANPGNSGAKVPAGNELSKGQASGEKPSVGLVAAELISPQAVPAENSGPLLESKGSLSSSGLSPAGAATGSTAAVASATAGSEAARTGTAGQAPKFPPHLLGRTDEAHTTHSTVRMEVDATKFVQRVARAFEAADQRGGEVRLRLSPPELGALQLSLTIQDGVMNARMEAETKQAQSILIDNLPALRERLQEQGFKIERFDVELMQQRNGGAFDQSRDQQTAGDNFANQRGTPNAGRGSEAKPVSAETGRRTVSPTASGGLNVIV